MSESIEINTVAAVPDDTNKPSVNVQTKLGHVAKFDQDDQSERLLNDKVNYKKEKIQNEFIGLTKEELKNYINDPKWKRIRWLIVIFYAILLISLLIGSALLILFSPRCPPKPTQTWYQKDIIYEIDVKTFSDSNQDGIGDIKGVEDKLTYIEKNNIKSILFQSSIFNATTDLYEIDPLVGGNQQFDGLAKTLSRKDFRIIIDLPIASTNDRNGVNWYGSKSAVPNKIADICSINNHDLACHYLQNYERVPLDFNDPNVSSAAKSRINHWLSNKRVDGVRVNLPLELNKTTNSYKISYRTIDDWISTVKNIEKKTNAKLFLIDIPMRMRLIAEEEQLFSSTAHPIIPFENNLKYLINAENLDERLQGFDSKNISKPRFWKVGSKRYSDDTGIIEESQLEKEFVLAFSLLIGGTPIVLYGEEINLNQRENELMAWTPDSNTGGFSNCTTNECNKIISQFRLNPKKTNVKLQEAFGDPSKDSILTVFRYLTKLRSSESFQFGLTETGYNRENNIFWIIREASGHRGFVVVFNLNPNTAIKAHISLHDLTKGDVPLHIHPEYQWPNRNPPTANRTNIDSDNLLISPRSINIFSWREKPVKPNILFQTAQKHDHLH